MLIEVRGWARGSLHSQQMVVILTLTLWRRPNSLPGRKALLEGLEGTHRVGVCRVLRQYGANLHCRSVGSVYTPALQLHQSIQRMDEADVALASMWRHIK